MTTKTPPRWRAVVTYRSQHGPVDVAHEFEEIADLHNLIERGPHWACISSIRVTLARNSHGGPLTIEEAEKL